MNAKTKLLERVEPNKIQFVTKRDPQTPDHAILFHSRTYFRGMIFKGSGSTKRKAEVALSEKIMEEFFSPKQFFAPKQKVTFKPPLDYFDELTRSQNFQEADRIILLDAENITITREQMKITYGTQILAFVAKNTTKTSIFNLEGLFSFVHVFVSERVGRDAADFLLAFYAGKLSMLRLKIKIYILTKDHYGEHLENFLDQGKYVCRYQDGFE